MRISLPELVLTAVSFSAPATAQDRDLIWGWNPQCFKPTAVALQVRLDGASIYSTSLPLCRWGPDFEKGKASFHFTPARPLVWYGYRSDPEDGSEDAGDTTAAGTTLDVDFSVRRRNGLDRTRLCG